MLKKLKNYVHGRVLTQLVIFCLISVGLLAAVSYDAIEGEISLVLVALGLAIGLAVGYAVARIFKLGWHQDTQKVVMSLDRMSFILIGVYILFRIFGDQVLGHYIHGQALTAFSFALLSGILLGRLISIWSGVTRILKQQGIV